MRETESESALIAYHYFDFKDATKRHLRGLLSSLLMQLCDHSFGCWDVLYQLYASCKDGSEQPSEAALAGCLKNMLELPGQVPIYIIVDALDEVGISGQDQIAGISQGWKLTGAIKTAECKLADGSLRHSEEALMAWAAAKIDPLVSAFNAIALMSMNPWSTRPSIFVI